MIKPPGAVSRELRYPKGVVWILFATVLVLRLLMMPINEAEYTDGVLQARQFVNPVGIWPPLYSGLIYILKFIFDYLYAGRLVSVLASSLAIIPLYAMTKRAFGTRAAMYAGIFYIVAPVANRWGMRLMTDATFSLFFIWCCERLYFASDERDQKKAFWALGWACIAAVLGTLTRYQGLMLFPPIALCAVILWRRFKVIPYKPLLFCLCLGLLPVWEMMVGGFIHDDQFQDRSLGQETSRMLQILALNAEAFILYMPYYLTYPVAVLAMAGMFWNRMRRGYFFAFLVIYTAIVLILVQSAFSSFQERYFLPLMSFFWMLAGAGMFSVHERWFRGKQKWKQRLFPYFLIFVYGYSAAFTVAVLVAQRESWGDVARASEFVGEVAPENAQIFTNEVYKILPSGPIAGDKVEFFSGRDGVVYLSNAYIPSNPNQPPTQEIPAGSYVVLSSLYGASYQDAYLRSYYRVSVVPNPNNPEAGTFNASIMPLLPDNTPGYDQSPVAWYYRYSWQNFSTTVLIVEGRR